MVMSLISIIPVFTHNRLQNYVWFIVNEATKQAVVVDPNSAEVTQQYLYENNLDLSAIWITHDHHDHVAGVAALKANYPDCTVVAHAKHKLTKGTVADVFVEEGSSFELWGHDVQVWALEGHKKYHVGYLLQEGTQRHVFSGDILFSAGCGRNFEGGIDELYASLQRLASLPDDTLFYPTHEFTVSNLNFALSVLPEDTALQAAKKAAQSQLDAGQSTLPTTLAKEKRINLFLRTHEVAVSVPVQKAHNDAQLESPLAVFAALRKQKDAF